MTSILIFFGRKAYILIDLRSIYSFIVCTLAIHTNREMMSLDCTLVLAISVGDFLLAESVFRDYIVRTCNNDIVVDLILLKILDFDIILGMNWLVNYHATIDFFF